VVAISSAAFSAARDQSALWGAKARWAGAIRCDQRVMTTCTSTRDNRSAFRRTGAKLPWKLSEMMDWFKVSREERITLFST